MFCEYLKQRKTQLGITVQELSDVSGVPLQTINNILCGRTSNPGIDAAAALMQAVSGSLDEACDLTTPPPKPAPNACDNCKLINLYRERIKQKDRYVIVLFAVCSFLSSLCWPSCFMIYSTTIQGTSADKGGIQSMATAKKRGPDQWRCLVYVGKDVTKSGYKSFTGKTKKEAERKALAFESELKENSLTVGDAIDRYIQSKEAVLSPATIVGYKKIRRNNLSSLMPIRAAALTQEMVQHAINQEVAAGASPRTQRHIVALLSPALKMFGYTMPAVRLSEKEKKEREIPSTAQVQQLLNASTGDLHFAILLAAELGLSRSEICALTRADFAGGLVRIHAAVVQNDKKEWVVKQPKETARYRSIPLTPAVAAIVSGWPVLDDTKAISLTPGALSSDFYDLCKKVLPRTYGLHALRHYNVSLMLAANIPPKYIIDRTGHETTRMVDTVYGHIIQTERDAAAEKFNAFLARQLQDK